MITSIATTKLTDRSVVAACPLGFSLQGTGVSVGVPSLGLASFGTSAVRMGSLATLPVRELGIERPIQAPAVAAVAQAETYAMAAANGAENQTKHHQMWASRGLEPWSDPT
ncbi:hypothetical protein H8N00_01760 [Streptomyces sp. AC563]|uniref:hypothetical protein n=1 Tax=Streptomyces buecherae TaxID=2763006 RepID=UPI00164D2812|nr:hypothetical protein [Streptomyces buecherae]MBC3987655.1 hypothetical protein [Streptomyces buecherae]